MGTTLSIKPMSFIKTIIPITGKYIGKISSDKNSYKRYDLIFILKFIVGTFR